MTPYAATIELSRLITIAIILRLQSNQRRLWIYVRICEYRVRGNW